MAGTSTSGTLQTPSTWNMKQTGPTILEDNNGFVSVRFQVTCYKAQSSRLGPIAETARLVHVD